LKPVNITLEGVESEWEKRWSEKIGLRLLGNRSPHAPAGGYPAPPSKAREREFDPRRGHEWRGIRWQCTGCHASFPKLYGKPWGSFNA